MVLIIFLAKLILLIKKLSNLMPGKMSSGRILKLDILS